MSSETCTPRLSLMSFFLLFGCKGLTIFFSYSLSCLPTHFFKLQCMSLHVHILCIMYTSKCRPFFVSTVALILPWNRNHTYVINFTVACFTTHISFFSYRLFFYFSFSLPCDSLSFQALICFNNFPSC